MARRKKKLVSIRKPKLRITKKGLKIQPPSARIGGKAGINISKSGVSGSVRSKYGTYNTKRGCTANCFGAFILLFLGGAFSLLAVTSLLAQTTPVPFAINLPIVINAEAQPTPTTVLPTATSLPTVPPTATATSVPPTATQPAPTATATSAPNAVCDCSGNTLNCSDFNTQDEAQACHDYCMGQTGIDIHRLDQDNNGVACESLPVWIVSTIK